MLAGLALEAELAIGAWDVGQREEGGTPGQAAAVFSAVAQDWLRTVLGHPRNRPGVRAPLLPFGGRGRVAVNRPLRDQK